MLGEMLGEFERFANISVSASVSECLVNSSQLTPSPDYFKRLTVQINYLKLL